MALKERLEGEVGWESGWLRQADRHRESWKKWKKEGWPVTDLSWLFLGFSRGMTMLSSS